jgi:branched-chain amino acid transport system ATP-binding protein
MAFLNINCMSKYFGGLPAIKDLDLDINKGEILGLIGPNGSGKTTVLNVISGVFRPTKGRVIFKGQDITGFKPHRIAEKGLIRTFQLTTIFKGKTVLENVVLAHHLQSKAGFWRRVFNTSFARQEEGDIKRKSMNILEFIGLAVLSNERAKNLPHGHQRAIEVAIALAANPELLMLDEPVSGMNPEETATMMGLIREIRGRGITILLVEHDMKAIMGLSDRIVALNFGHKISEGLPQEIRENKEVIDAYLGREEDVF